MTKDDACGLCRSRLDPAWVLAYRDVTPHGQGTREALLTLGNGYLATRGAAPETTAADPGCYPGTYLAGFYNRLVSTVDGQAREDESLVNLPNWLPLTFRPAGGEWMCASTPRAHEHLALDLRHGLLSRELVLVDREDRRTRIRQRRLVSMAAPHLVAMHTCVVAENWSGRLDLRSGLDARVSNGNSTAFSGLADHHLTGVETGTDGEDVMWLAAQACNSRLRVAQAARNRVCRDGRAEHASRGTVTGPDQVWQNVTVHAGVGEEISVEKVAAIYSSRDRAQYEPLVAACQELTDAGTFEELLAAHGAAWEQLWQRFHLGLGDAREVDLAANADLFHLLQTLSPHTADLDVGVPARGLHGEGYHGHVFWDELFVFPFFNFRLPELTRALLQYRHRRLPPARRRAAALGMRGALFPWQSGSDGREESPTHSLNPRTGRWMPDNSSRQYHINLAIAYNVWRYWQITADVSFLAAYGAELIVETARFWADFATYDPADDRYDIRGVMGPDEFHDGYPDRPGLGIDNNAYVNIMTTWALARARDVHQILSHHDNDQLWHNLGLSTEEVQTWEHIGSRLRLSFLPGGVLEQFEGYRHLAELDWAGYRRRYGDLKQLGQILDAEHDTTNRYQASKQADVLMLLYLFSVDELTGLIRGLGYDFDPASIPPTIERYLARTCHGSSLSRSAHAWVLARADRRTSWPMLRDALTTDLADVEGSSTPEGIHLGAIAGALDILQRCYTGLDSREDTLRLDPMLPEELRHLELDIRYRGQWIKLRVEPGQLTIQALPGSAPPVAVTVRDASHRLEAGTTIEVPL